MNRRSENPYEAFRLSRHGKLRVRRDENLFTRKKRRRPVLRALLLTLAVLIAVGAAYNAAINRGVRVEHVTVSIPTLPDAFEGFTLAQLSDLYGAELGAGNARVLDALAGQRCGAVCLTGDMLAPDGDPQPFWALLDALRAHGPVFFVSGEQDPAATVDGQLAEWIVGAQARGATYLDAPTAITRGDASLWLAPELALTLNVEATQRTLAERVAQEGETARQTLAYQLDRAARIAQARAAMADTDVCIALTHIPLTAEFLSGTAEQHVVNRLVSRLNLVLAGHYNGGQARLPLLGAIYVPQLGFFPGADATSGLMRVGELTQYVSPGLGVNPRHVLPLRLFNAPTVTLLHLTKAL